jgi:histidine phosphotransferase ChpT
MAVKVELAILELLCSRLCHDLVGPVGAATNGIELLRDLSGNQNADILDMTDESARTAWRRLEFFRVAFGYGGGREGWSETELISLASGMLADTRVSLLWPQAGLAAPVSSRSAKLVLNLVFLIAEALPRGGQVKVLLQPADTTVRVMIEGHGPGATLNPRVQAAATGQALAAELDSRVILAHMVYLLSVDVSSELVWDFHQDCVSVQLDVTQEAMAEV